MINPRKPWITLFSVAAMLTFAGGCNSTAQAQVAEDRPADVIRFATFNAALSGKTADDLPRRLSTPDDPKLKKIAAIIQHVRPDVLLINEFDHGPEAAVLAMDFLNQYLMKPQNGLKQIFYEWMYSPPVNTGVLTGIDLDGDGQTTGPGDAHGWGDYPGQYGMLILVRQRPTELTLKNLNDQRGMLWAKQPDHKMPLNHYPPQAPDELRLSSKTHLFLPIDLDGHRFDLLVSHPTPPVFDGPEDRNGRRNFDEIALLSRMVTQNPKPIVVLGDLNADPNDGESIPGAINQLLNHPRIIDPQPASRGAVEKSLTDGGINAEHQTDPALDTADWHDRGSNGSGNLRVDYVLPTTDWRVVDAGVFWPAADEPGHDLIDASDHRLVWVDLTLDAD